MNPASSSGAPALSRRAALAGLAVAGAGLGGCLREQGARPSSWQGGWVGDITALGHRWRDDAAWRSNTAAAAGVQRRADVIILGGGVAGLAAARALREQGVEDIAVLEPHASPGGNSRGHVLAGRRCPMGAHYLPTPGDAAPELQRWLLQLGLARQQGAGLAWDERALCHAPQERLWFDGTWHAGLLPPWEAGSAGWQQARRLAQLTAALMREQRFAMPSQAVPWTPTLAALDAQTFAAWLDAQGLDDPALRWYLDYCCRDDYGAPAAVVSAWAGLQYFCSRHGFLAPDTPEAEASQEPVLTWPEGNAWLVERLASGLDSRLHLNRLALQVVPGRQGVEVLAWRADEQQVERWQAQQVVLAVPLAMGARLLGEQAPAALQTALRAQRVAPWLVANVLLSREPLERPGQLPAWDNVAYGQASLGYVRAQHQLVQAQPRGSSVVLTAYEALGPEQRQALAEEPWQHWAERVVKHLAVMHPDLPATVQQVDLVRHGHAMSTPVPGTRSSPALALLREAGSLGPRVHWAHADLVGYSVFEEAFTLGDAVGRRVASRWVGSSPRRS